MSQSEAKTSVYYSEEGHGDNYLAELMIEVMNTIRYLKPFYSLTTTKAKFSDDFTDTDSLKSLAIIQLAIKTL